MATTNTGGTVLVTGATGFIGANFVYQLAKSGHRVIANDVNAPIPLLREYWAPYAERIVFEVGSVTDAARLNEIADVHGLEGIVHAAAITAVDPATEARLGARMLEVNIMGTLQLLELARRTRVRRLVYISSSGIYGFDDKNTIPETAVLPTENLDLYTISKRTSEELCLRYAVLLEMDIVIGRLNGPYGPMERDTGVRPLMSPIYQLVRAALVQNEVRIRASDGVFDWTYVLDLATSVQLLLDAPRLPHRIYNLSGGTLYTLEQALDLLQEILPTFQYRRVEAGEAADIELHLPNRGALDISRLESDVNYAPAFDLRQGLVTALPWWRKMVELEH